MAMPDLTDSAKEALAEIARMLAHGFSGEIRLECNQGGVRCVRRSDTLWPPKIEGKP